MHSRRPDPARPSPAIAMIIAGEGFHDLPLGGSAGEMLPTPTPAPAPGPGLVIEAPPWTADLESGNLDVASLAPPAPTDTLTALTALEYDPPAPALGPPLMNEPLARATFPAPDWRAEETARAEREREQEPAKSLEPRPAPPRGARP